MRHLFLATTLALFALPAVADETQGLVLAYDRQANLLVMNDKTVWELPSGLLIPADLGAGDRVALFYETAGEDGMIAIDSLNRIASALPAGTDGGI